MLYSFFINQIRYFNVVIQQLTAWRSWDNSSTDYWWRYPIGAFHHSDFSNQTDSRRDRNRSYNRRSPPSRRSPNAGDNLLLELSSFSTLRRFAAFFFWRRNHSKHQFQTLLRSCRVPPLLQDWIRQSQLRKHRVRVPKNVVKKFDKLSIISLSQQIHMLNFLWLCTNFEILGIANPFRIKIDSFPLKEICVSKITGQSSVQTLSSHPTSMWTPSESNKFHHQSKLTWIPTIHPSGQLKHTRVSLSVLYR